MEIKNYCIEGYHIVEDNKLFGIKRGDEWIIPLEYDYISPVLINNIYIEVVKNNLKGFYNIEGKLIFDTLYSDYFMYRDKDYVKLCKDGKWGFMNYNGHVLISFEWDYLTDPYGDNMFIICTKNGLQGQILLDGTILIKPEWESISTFNNGICSVLRNNQYYRLDIKGNIINNR